MMKRLVTCCAVAVSIAFTAGAAFAADDTAVTSSDVSKFNEAPAQFVAAFKDDALTEAVYQLAMADVDTVPSLVALLDTMSEGDKRLLAAGLGRAARAYAEAKDLSKAVKIQQAIARQSDAVRLAFNVGAGQKLLGQTSTGSSAGGGGSVQTNSTDLGGNNPSLNTAAPSTTVASSSSGSLGSAGGGGSTGDGGSSGSGTASGSTGPGGIVINIVNNNTNSSCSGSCGGAVSP